MRLSPVAMENFGGLNLTADPQDLGLNGAVDVMNIDFSAAGRLRSRTGYTTFATPSSTVTGLHSFSNPVGAANLVAVTTTAAYIYNISGTALYTSTVTRPNSDTWFADGGDPDQQYSIFTVRGEAFINFWPFGSTVSGVVPVGPATGDVIPGAFNAGPLAITPWDHRLMACDPVTSAVYFSGPGDLSAFATNDFLMLDPGDGEHITEAVAWGNQVFVFKQTKFYVFYGTGTDSSGQPVFNYRTVNSRQGAISAGCAVAAPEGVYFLNPAGLWLTSGAAPRKVSGDVDPLFMNGSMIYSGESVGGFVLLLAEGHCKLVLAENKVHILNGPFTLFYDRRGGQWGTTDVPVKKGAGLNMFGGVPSTNGSETLVFSNGSNIYKMGWSTDNGAAITARYRTGFFAPFSRSPGSEGIVREWLLDGYGTVTVKTAVNDTVALGAGAAVTMVADDRITTQRRDRRSVRGRNVSVELSGSGEWGLSSLIANVADPRGSGQQQA